MEKTILAIEGMMCDGCVASVKMELEDIPGVQQVEVSLAQKQATVLAEAGKVSRQQLEQAVQTAGFKVV